MQHSGIIQFYEKLAKIEVRKQHIKTAEFAVNREKEEIYNKWII